MNSITTLCVFLFIILFIAGLWAHRAICKRIDTINARLKKAGIVNVSLKNAKQPRR